MDSRMEMKNIRKLIELGLKIRGAVTIVGDGEFGRSPCGTGTAARMACLYGRGELDYRGSAASREREVGAGLWQGRRC